jgi:hypothetical protein
MCTALMFDISHDFSAEYFFASTAVTREKADFNLLYHRIPAGCLQAAASEQPGKIPTLHTAPTAYGCTEKVKAKHACAARQNRIIMRRFLVRCQQERSRHLERFRVQISRLSALGSLQKYQSRRRHILLSVSDVHGYFRREVASYCYMDDNRVTATRFMQLKLFIDCRISGIATRFMSFYAFIASITLLSITF